MWGECQESCPGIKTTDFLVFHIYIWTELIGFHVEVDRCLASDGWPCVFPFEYKDVVYHSCAYVDHSRPWCSILNHANGSVDKWQTCEESEQCAGES